MNILVTGANGFLGKEFQNISNNSKHEFIFTSRKQLNPTSFENVKDFFINNKIDIVLHTAVKGGKKDSSDTIFDLENNLKMFYNLQEFSNKFKLMINFGSGAEFDRRYDISNINEEKIFDKLPEDYYGLSKNIISRTIVSNTKENNIFNLRLFGCFGELEEEQRFFKNSFNRSKNNEGILVHQDRLMDYFYVGDLINVVEHLIQNGSDILDRDINLCYEQKYSLSEIGTIFNSFLPNDNSLRDIKLNDNSIGKEYTGNGSRLSKLGIKLLGLEKGIEKCLIKWNKS